MAAAPPGWYGKIAALGDFASRRLEPAWVQTVDRWLAAGIDASRAELGERWLAAYLGAPLWRFAWGPQVVDASWWFGVLMMSCDKVGRYFPLVIAQARPLPPAERFALEHLDLWWTRIASAALGTLGEGGQVESFEAALAEAPPWPVVRAAEWTRGESRAGAEHFSPPEGAELVEVAQALAAAGLQQRLVGHSFWWPWRPQSDAGQCTLVQGLPAAQAFAGLLRPH